MLPGPPPPLQPLPAGSGLRSAIASYQPHQPLSGQLPQAAGQAAPDQHRQAMLQALSPRGA